MKQLTLKSSVLLFSSVILLSSCDAKMEMDKEQGASKSLDLSLNLDVVEHEQPVYVRGGGAELQGLFSPKEELSNVEVEAHFESPHQENKDRETTPDGAGLAFKMGI